LEWIVVCHSGQDLFFSFFYHYPVALRAPPLPGLREKQSFSWVDPSEGELFQLCFNKCCFIVWFRPTKSPSLAKGWRAQRDGVVVKK
jgi:hypothetical protein